MVVSYSCELPGGKQFLTPGIKAVDLAEARAEADGLADRCGLELLFSAGAGGVVARLLSDTLSDPTPVYPVVEMVVFEDHAGALLVHNAKEAARQRQQEAQEAARKKRDADNALQRNAIRETVRLTTEGLKSACEKIGADWRSVSTRTSQTTYSVHYLDSANASVFTTVKVPVFFLPGLPGIAFRLSKNFAPYWKDEGDWPESEEDNESEDLAACAFVFAAVKSPEDELSSVYPGKNSRFKGQRMESPADLGALLLDIEAAMNQEAATDGKSE